MSKLKARSRPKVRAYLPKTLPREHQAYAFELAKDVEYFALFMEMGTGKTKVDIDCSAYSYERGLIDAWAIVAPAGVHLNWVRQELPKHLPDRLEAALFAWDSGKARSKSYQAALKEILLSPFPIVAFNVDALLTEPGLDALRYLLRQRVCKLTVDESNIIKNPKAQRTKLLLKAAALAAQRRILNGTPITNGPLNLYAQCLFLDEAIFGYSSYFTFAHHYAEWTKKRNWAQGRDYEELVCYRNLDELVKRLEPVSFRVTKAECLDLPPKTYLPPRYFELSKEQAKLYAALRDDFIAELEGEQLTASLAITRLLRLQQVTCGYFPTDAGTLKPVPGPNRRLDAYLAELEDADPKKAIVWARFQADGTVLEAALKRVYGAAAVVRYDGTVTDQRVRRRAIETFQNVNSAVRFFVGNPQAAGRGLDLYAAEHVTYYSNSFSLDQRLQSEDRAHRDGLTHPVAYSDLVAVDTVDEHIVEALRSNRELADGILQQLPRWL